MNSIGLVPEGRVPEMRCIFIAEKSKNPQGYYMNLIYISEN